MCGDTTNNSTCDTSWTSVGNVTSATWPGAALAYDTLYYWQVRAMYGGGYTPADSGTWWSFRTQVQAPAAFGKSAPANGATGDVDESDADVGDEHAGDELRVLLRHDE